MSKIDYIFEGCCTSPEQVLQARVSGAVRVELCSRLEIGGVTPSEELIRASLTAASAPKSVLTKMLPNQTLLLDQLSSNDLGIKLNVLVRPRGGDFVYSEKEVLQMEKDIDLCKNLKVDDGRGGLVGVNGVVIGALLPDGGVDLPAMRRLVAGARPLEVTFHRAFDECRDVAEGLEDVISLGCERLLTSGHQADAHAGRFTLGKLVGQAAGRIIILAGCGVRPHNIKEISEASGAPEFHSSTLTGW